MRRKKKESTDSKPLSYTINDREYLVGEVKDNYVVGTLTGYLENDASYLGKRGLIFLGRLRLCKGRCGLAKKPDEIDKNGLCSDCRLPDHTP